MTIGEKYSKGEWSSQAERLLALDPQWAAPLLWRSEFCNVLALYIRKGHLSLEQAQQIMREAMMLMEGREYEVISSRVLELVASSVCSAYDFEFAALAQDLEITLVTVDQKLLKAFPQIALSLDEFIAR